MCCNSRACAKLCAMTCGAPHHGSGCNSRACAKLCRRLGKAKLPDPEAVEGRKNPEGTLPGYERHTISAYRKLAAIKKLKPEYSPQVNSAWLFARKRLGELTPKEPGPGRGKKESDNNDSFSQKEKDRRWENAALAEFWEHPELNPRLGHNGGSRRGSGNCWSRGKGQERTCETSRAWQHSLNC